MNFFHQAFSQLWFGEEPTSAAHNYDLLRRVEAKIDTPEAWIKADWKIKLVCY